MSAKRHKLPIFKWCKECKKDTHNTEDCWGPGTVSYEPKPPYNAPPQFFNIVMSAIRLSDSTVQTNDQPFCRINL